MEKKQICVSDNLFKLAKQLEEKAKLYIVGGYVRNCLLGIEKTDIDLASKLTPTELMNALKNTEFTVKEKSRKMGTVAITIGEEEYEHTTFRSEQYQDGGHHSPIYTNFVIELNEDAKRRDFTINAIYYDILAGEIIDIYSGMLDLEKKVIRCIETPEFVFCHDGLRILRMVRLACELNFKIDKETLLQASKMSYYLKDITGQRKQKELFKILESGKRYKISSHSAHIRGLKCFNKLKLWVYFYSNVSKIKIKMAKKAKSDIFCALLIDMINSINPDCVEYYLKHLLGTRGLMLSQRYKEYVINIVCGFFDAQNKLNNKNYFFKYYDNFNIIKQFIKLDSIFNYNSYNFFYKYITNNKIPVQIKNLAINGDDIKKYKPKLESKYYGLLLKHILDKVFRGEIQNTKEQLIKEIKNYEHN